jgi:hypothetical protein
VNISYLVVNKKSKGIIYLLTRVLFKKAYQNKKAEKLLRSSAFVLGIDILVGANYFSILKES